jgi:hypothetical protein
MLDLSHWFCHHSGKRWDLSISWDRPARELIDYHRESGVGFYLPPLVSFFDVEYGPGVRATTTRSDDGMQITWRFETPLGSIQRTRIWEEASWSWGIREWPVQDERQLRVLGAALSSRTYRPRWDRYLQWNRAVGDLGVVYMPVGYSAMGHLLGYWMGVERTAYATMDFPDALREEVDRVNENLLSLVALVAQSPAEVIFMGDNFSSDIQPPGFFDTWSRAYYTEAVRRLHAAGKHVSVHVDGRLRGALRMIRQTGADCADAVTPTPLGDLTPEQCRDEAGRDFILSGGVSPDLWRPEVPMDVFSKAVLRWLELRLQSPRLIANAGDQVPPGAEERRIEVMRDLVDAHGRY